MPYMALVERGTSEWGAMWSLLLDYDRDLRRRAGETIPVPDMQSRHPRSFETWQYLGSLELEEKAWHVGPGFVHQFRHRDHPATNQREYVNIASSTGWKP